MTLLSFLTAAGMAVKDRRRIHAHGTNRLIVSVLISMTYPFLGANC